MSPDLAWEIQCFAAYLESGHACKEFSSNESTLSNCTRYARHVLDMSEWEVVSVMWNDGVDRRRRLESRYSLTEK